jgi:hypothetical protein
MVAQQQRWRRKGDVVWHRLDGDLDGVEVGIAHVGPGTAREWAFRLQGTQLRELRRRLEAQTGLTPEVAPALWEPGWLSPEGALEQLDILELILAECVTGIRGHEEAAALETSEDRAEWLRYAGVLEQLVRPALEQQSLRPPLPLAADPGDSSTVRPASVGTPGSDDGSAARASARAGR